MDGWPVWLASLSIRDPFGDLLPTESWSVAQRQWGDVVIDTLLGDLGDLARQRSFRMCATLCRHRALSEEEAAAVPPEWFTIPGEHLAGGSLEVLWETVPGAPSTQPCENPGRDYLDRRLYLPVDCGQCPPCRARAAIE